MPKAAFMSFPEEIEENLKKLSVTPKFRASYQHMTSPWSGQEDKDPRYSIQMIFDMSDPKVAKWMKSVKALF